MELSLSQILPNLPSYYNDKKRSDITVVINDPDNEVRAEFYLNKFILMVASDYFAGLFRKNPNATKTELEGDPDLFGYLMEWLYTGAIPVLDQEYRATYFLLLSQLADLLGINNFSPLFIDRMKKVFYNVEESDDVYSVLLTNHGPYYSVFIRESLKKIDAMFMKDQGLAPGTPMNDLMKARQDEVKSSFIDRLLDVANSADDEFMMAIPEERFEEIIDMVLTHIQGPEHGGSFIPQNLIKFMNRYTALTGVQYPEWNNGIVRVTTEQGLAPYEDHMGGNIVSISMLNPAVKLNTITSQVYSYPEMNDDEVTASMFDRNNTVEILPSAINQVLPKEKRSSSGKNGLNGSMNSSKSPLGSLSTGTRTK